MSYITYAEKLKDPRWQKTRLLVFQRDNFTCQRCGNSEDTLHVHHFCYPESRNPWDSELSDMVTWCSNCHTVDHLKNLTPLEKDLIELLESKLVGNHLYLQCLMSIILKHKKNG